MLRHAVLNESLETGGVIYQATLHTSQHHPLEFFFLGGGAVTAIKVTDGKTNI